MMFSRIGVVLGLALAASSAFSQTVKEKKEIAEANKDFVAEVEETNKACGTKIAATMNWKSFKYENGWGISSAASFCKDSLSGVRGFCEGGADEKAAVKKAITKFSCSYTPKMTDDEFQKTGVKLSGGGLSVTVSWANANLGRYVKEHLEGKL